MSQSQPSQSTVFTTGSALADERFDERGMPIGTGIDTTWEIGPRDVHRRVFGVAHGAKVREGDTVPVLLDCRTQQEVDLATIKGSVLVPTHDLTNRLEELQIPFERPIVVYCHRGGRSLKVTQTLREMGYQDVRSMAGGIDLWSQSVDRGVPRY